LAVLLGWLKLSSSSDVAVGFPIARGGVIDWRGRLGVFRHTLVLRA